ncbi:MAG: DNA adenine methylase [Chitinophagaceae bacterium]|nr:MAG: DNA adenine methylase [Chitinophagaceae bacterium]
MDYYSPLRYPGGKGKVASYFKQVFHDNLLYDGVYVEPYAGGASVALSLLFNEYASKIVINDIDRSIFAFWHSVLHKTDELCRLINDTPVTVQNWDIQRQTQKNKQRQGLLKVGFSTFFLNRTNRSGILNAGIIGGRQQTGNWKIDARYNKKDLIARIQRIALYKDKIELHNSDAVELVKSLRKSLPSKTLFYFDPPYYVKGKDLYLNYYGDEDHQEIATEIAKLKKQKWIVTYDNVHQIKNLYTDFRQVKYTLNYSAAEPSKGQEVMIFSDNMYITKHSIIV